MTGRVQVDPAGAMCLFRSKCAVKEDWSLDAVWLCADLGELFNCMSHRDVPQCPTFSIPNVLNSGAITDADLPQNKTDTCVHFKWPIHLLYRHKMQMSFGPD